MNLCLSIISLSSFFSSIFSLATNINCSFFFFFLRRWQWLLWSLSGNFRNRCETGSTSTDDEEQYRLRPCDSTCSIDSEPVAFILQDFCRCKSGPTDIVESPRLCSQTLCVFFLMFSTRRKNIDTLLVCCVRLANIRVEFTGKSECFSMEESFCAKHFGLIKVTLAFLEI